jgi:peptidyl-prolyl cis-trans isomerase D
MAMLITKFNKLIANRFVWIGFTVLIVLAFVAWDISIPDDGQDPAARAAAGTLNGKPISSEELRQAYIHAYLSVVLALGQMPQINSEMDAELTDMAWKRIVTLQKADQLDLQANDREIVTAIRNFSGFQNEDQFSPEIYQSFLQQFLGNMGFNPAQFEEHVRQELIIQKLQRMVAETALVTPFEINRAIQSFGDTFTIQYATINRDVLGEGLTLSDEEVAAYFEENAEAFTIPAKVRVNYVRFPIAEYAAAVEVSEDEALDYYDLNIEEFTVVQDQSDTNALASGDDLFEVSATQPFEEVRDEIIDNLRNERAARQAADTAMDFVVSLVPDRLGEAPSFAEAASAQSLSVEQAGPFARGELIEGIDAGAAFSRAAFDLQPNNEYYFSDPIEGEDFFYVIALTEEIPPYVPELDEVIDDVRAAAEAAALETAVIELADAFREAAETGLAEGTSFAEIAESFAVPVSEPITVTAAEGLDDVEYGQQLITRVMGYNQGEVARPIELADRFLVPYVVERQIANPDDFRDFRPQIVATIAGERTRVLFDAWQDQLLREADFQPRMADQPIDEEAPGDLTASVE